MFRKCLLSRLPLYFTWTHHVNVTMLYHFTWSCTWLSTMGHWGIGAGTRAFLSPSATCHTAQAPGSPCRPVSIDWDKKDWTKNKLCKSQGCKYMPSLVITFRTSETYWYWMAIITKSNYSNCWETKSSELLTTFVMLKHQLSSVNRPYYSPIDVFYVWFVF